MSLDAWETIFGGQFKSLLVFAYDLAAADPATRTSVVTSNDAEPVR